MPTGIYERTEYHRNRLKRDKAWNTGLTKETDERVKKYSEKRIGIKKSPEAIRKFIISRSGKPNSEEQKKKQSESMKIYYKNNPEAKKRLSLMNIGCKRTDEHKKILRELHLGEKNLQFGIKRSPEYRLRMSLERQGEKAYNWKGNTKIKELVRKSCFYREWRDLIYKRDNYTCKKCGKIGGKLNAHHRIAFNLIIDLNNIKTLNEAISCKKLWDLNNGITLCKECHKLINNYKSEEEYNENECSGNFGNLILCSIK